jgi:hypothetical protein
MTSAGSGVDIFFVNIDVVGSVVGDRWLVVGFDFVNVEVASILG